MTRHRTAERHELVAAHCPLIADAEQHVGYVSVRNRGTVGGSIAHADTVAELTCVAVALGATVVLQSASGRRDVAIADFLVANLINTREPDEIVTEIRFPASESATLTGFAEFARKTGDFPLVTAAVRAERDGDAVRDVRIGVGGVASTPIRLAECEELIEGSVVSGDLLDQVTRTAAAAVHPSETPFVSVDYRRHLSGVVVRRALERAFAPTVQEGPAS